MSAADRGPGGGLDFLRLLPPDAVGQVAGLEFIARGKMEGFFTGRHRSPRRGASAEFLQHRPYVVGDDPGDLDWRVYGRSDRYYIRQYVEETNLRCTILLDASGSMAYRGEKAARLGDRPLSKFEYARHLAAVFAHLLIQQQDAAGLVTFDKRVRRYLPAASRASQVRVLLDEMLRTEPGDESGLAGVFHDIAERVPRRGLIVIVSDLFDAPDPLIRALHHFRYRRHEVVVWHVMAEEELAFPFKDFTQFRDLERMASLVALDPKAIRARYLDRLQAFLDAVHRGCGELNADYVPMVTSKPFGRALADYLASRAVR